MAEPAQAPNPKKKLSPLRLARESWGPYKDLLPYLFPYRARFLAGVLSGAAAGIVSGLLGLIIKHVSDQVFHGQGGPARPSFSSLLSGGSDSATAALSQGPGIEAVLWTCSLIPAVIIARSLFSYLNSYCITWVSLRVLNDLRNDVFAKVINQSIDFFNKSQSGKLMSRVMNDSRVAQTALTQISSDVVVQPCTILAAIVALLILDWKFTLISLTLFPLCLVPIIVFGRKVRKAGKDEESMAGAMMTVLHEAFTGVRVVKALGREPFEIEDFKESAQQQFRRAIRVRKSIEIVGPIIESISAIGAGLALVYVWKQGLTAGGFLGLLTGLFMLYDPVKKLSKIHVMVQKALSATDRIFELMRMTPTVQDDPGAPALKHMNGCIELKDVHFSYLPDRPALEGINLLVEPGKTYALVGASGSGKSTILSLLLRFYDPDKGVIAIDGQDIRHVTQASLRENVAIVSQETFLFHTTIMENIRYGRLDATDEEVLEAARQAFAHDFILLQPDGYQTVIGDKGCTLSGGQQQRLAIARALLRNAPILLLDEATSALDSESEKQIQIALERLSRGRTVIAIAHRLSTILKADQIVAMQSGRIIETGTHDELFARNGHYRRLYDLQFNQQEEPVEDAPCLIS